MGVRHVTRHSSRSRWCPLPGRSCTRTCRMRPPAGRWSVPRQPAQAEIDRPLAGGGGQEVWCDVYPPLRFMLGMHF